MSFKKKKWIYNFSFEEKKKIKKLKKKLNINFYIAELLTKRHIFSLKEAKKFFFPKITLLYNPFLIKDIEKAVFKILKKIYNKKKILIYGDYDTDGITSIIIIFFFIKKFNKNIIYYIPDRENEGYGISIKILKLVILNKISLIIILDCGIKNISEIEYANNKGITSIICDHHLPEKNLPNALAILNTKRKDCNYPFKELTGCGIVFKFIQALSIKMNLLKENIYNYLDLVVLSISSDLVKIIDENRILSFYGLKKINKNPCIGIFFLLKKINIIQTITISDIIFKITPIINSSGRINNPKYSVNFFLYKQKKEIDYYICKIYNFNFFRKKKEKKIIKEALNLIKLNKQKNNFTTIIYEKTWNKGLLGIIASRLIEIYYRPTIIFSKKKKNLIGSIRSIKGLNIYKIIKKCSMYIEEYGGHKYAAGLKINPKYFFKFKKIFEKNVKNKITDFKKNINYKIDIKIDFCKISPNFLQILKKFSPFGPKNNKPIFFSKNVFSKYIKIIGKEKKHLKFQLYQKGQIYKFITIGFNMKNIFNFFKKKLIFDIIYSIEEKYWNNKKYIQFFIKDFNFF